jgi:glc operon protein GlcG
MHSPLRFPITLSLRLSLACGLLLAALALPLRAQLPTKPTLSLELAKKISAAAEAEAAKNKWTVVIALVDEGGNLLHLARMDGTQLGSITVAQEKAKTALNFKRSTKVFEDMIAGGRNAALSLPGVVAIEGGLPLVVDGAYLGAIGISGAKSSEDGVVAAAALAVLPSR